MTEQVTTTGCPRCAVLERRIAELEARLAELESRQARLAKNSGNSSKPPSSDIVKPAVAGAKRRSRRKRGAQPGHPKHERAAFSPEEIDRVKDYQFQRCPECDGPLELLDEPARVLQQIDIVVQPTRVTEHRSRTCRCPRCQKEFVKPITHAVRKAGLVGPRLTALTGYLKGACHCSFSTIRKFLQDVVGVSISRGQLRKVCGKVAHSLDQPYQDLRAALPEQERLNVDETGHKEYKQALWTWCFRAPLFTLFKIDPSRGSDVLLDVLGTEFSGVLGCDYFSADSQIPAAERERAGAVLPGSPDPRRAVPRRASPLEEPGLRPTRARSAPRPVWADPPPRNNVRGEVPRRIRRSRL
jgi:transposase